MAKKPKPTPPGTSTTKCESTCILSSEMHESYKLYSMTSEWVERGKKAILLNGEQVMSLEKYDQGSYCAQDYLRINKAEARELVKFMLDTGFVHFLDVMNRERFEALCEK